MKQTCLVILLVVCTQVFGQEGAFIETNGVKIYYEIHGEGEPLVLLHGNTGTLDSWNPWMKELAPSYKVITVDLRGHGQSTYPANDATHKQYALDVYGLLDALSIDEFRAIGFSTGGMTLIHMATMQPDRLMSLVLIGATSYFPAAIRDEMRSFGYENVSEKDPGWIEHLKNVQPGGEEQIKGVLNNFARWADSYDDMNFTPAYLSTISCPTLIIHGDSDSLFPVQIPLTMYESIPDSHLWIIPNHGHYPPQHGTALGDIFLHTITEFMAGNWDE
ncbi:alpha/beta hydrolase [Arenibacter sp. N53]|uniref:alpha/beta fold hydrolase n=1 Tax=Arenibacter TaxID=178469 RepID=UPI000CD3D5A6|nr:MULTISPECIES: alpha/beta hydrolase [Arenibacter]MCM4154294.1 alpha/beta hydrolase [Arenibacter sp. N53]